jgi:hypothetical protein
MKRIFAVSLIAVMAPLALTDARAQERAGDAALGALSGAVVLGPVGAVAGAVVGFTAGPHISRAWGLHGRDRRRVQRSARSAPPARDNVPPARSPAPARTQGTAPVSQSAPIPQAASTPAARPTRAASEMPPVQSFE